MKLSFSEKNPRKNSFEMQKDFAYSGMHVSSATMSTGWQKVVEQQKINKKQLLTKKIMKKD